MPVLHALQFSMTGNGTGAGVLLMCCHCAVVCIPHLATKRPSALAVPQALIRRRVRVVEEDALYRIMVPQPLPLSWGRTVQPYDPAISLLSRARALHTPMTPCAAFTDPPQNLSGDLNWEHLHGHETGLRAEHAPVIHLLVQNPPTEMLDDRCDNKK